MAACRRCLTCCRAGGPALHGADLDLLRRGVLAPTDLVCLRAGEPVHDQPRGGVFPLAAEIVKIRPRDGGSACSLLDEDACGCSIYADRPAECRALSCADTALLAAMYERDRLTRADLLPAGHALLELITEHERRCPAGRLDALARTFAHSRAADDELATMLRYDRELRLLFAERGLDPRLADALLGRSLDRVLAPMGVGALFAPDGRLRLRRTTQEPTR